MHEVGSRDFGLERDRLFADYLDELMRNGASLSDLPGNTAARMFEAIEDDVRAGRRSDWLKHNPLLKKACKKNGIKTSRQLRELFGEKEAD